MKPSTQQSLTRIPLLRDLPPRQSVLSTYTNPNELSLITRRPTRRQSHHQTQETPRRPTTKNGRISQSRSSVRSQLSSRTHRGKLVIEGLEEADMGSICAFVDGLLEERLRWLTDSNRMRGAEIREINEALERVKSHIFERRATGDVEEMSKEDIDSKLLLIDKVLAETAVEAEILRQKYFNLVNSRTTATKFFNFNKSCENLKNYMSESASRIEYSQSPKISIVKQTSYNTGFATPKKEMISLFKQPKKKYSYNLFPVPSSTYHVNYRSKENALPYPNSVKQQTFNAFKQYYPRGTAESLYSTDFSPKRQSEYINYKDQDCYKNKIKTLKIKYEPVQKLAIPMNKLAKLERQYSNLLNRSPSVHKSPSFKNHFTTSSSKEYNGIFKPKAVGKYDQLQKLKINYRNLVNFSKKKC